MSYSDSKTRVFPKQILITAASLTTLIFFLMGSYIFSSYRTFKLVSDRNLRITKTVGQIIHLDELLTMSARMCAATGDLAWEARYRKFGPVLDAALAELKKLSSEVYSSPEAAQTDTANLALVEMESSVFENLRAGRTEQAKAILLSEVYATQKRIYSDGMIRLTQRLEEAAGAKVAAEKIKTGWVLIGLAVAVPILLFGWLVILRAVVVWQALIKRQAAELENANSALDQKVRERTQQLEETNKALVLEVRERKKVSVQLLQSQKMETLGTLAGGIAHDLNNQLTPVRGYMDILFQETDPGHPNYQMLAEASQAAQRCGEVVQRLTQFSRPATQNRTVIFVSEIFREFKSVIEKFLPSTILVDFSCPKDTWPVEANETEIQTVLMNLCVNARDAMPQGGRLTIEAKNINLDPMPAGGVRWDSACSSLSRTPEAA